MEGKKIREVFTNYFVKHNHTKLASSGLIPDNDPTLLFANAGMNQFKNYFTGEVRPESKRAVTIQKCVRAGGKHNDLENVGMTARHHTFFEMLGNFSFGDYFKNEAIAMAWEFLTKELKIDQKLLYVTVHHTDDEAFKIWNEEIGISTDRIFKKGDKDNFWEMGDLGPCGPCSEIFYDHGEKNSTPGLVLEEGQDILEDESRYVEIWNLVFMQYEKTKEGRFPLPNPCIDTGAGLERLASVLQGVYWNYDTDFFVPIINKIEKLTGKNYSKDCYKSSMRIIADHIRSSIMLITDGVLPSNEGRGYVLRRIIRRAVRHCRELSAPKGIMASLVPTVMDTLGSEYPENAANIALATKLLEIEESKFLETLDKGLEYLNKAIKEDIVDGVMKGEAVFKLYDTYGFPVDLTDTILKEQNLQANLDDFQKLMKQRKEESKKTWKVGAAVDNKVFFDLKGKHGETEFLGYSYASNEAVLLDKVTSSGLSILIFDKTCFYGESGGQAGDRGLIKLDGKVLGKIEDVQKPVEGLFAHFAKNADALEVGKKYTLEVDDQRRSLIRKNHTATHLLQAALIDVLGDHVKQAGSNVTDERIRFDYTHHSSMTAEEKRKVENLVNKQIDLNLSAETNILTKDEAISRGAMALFGEKYGDSVRVLEIGTFSIELCGGLHVKNTSEISSFVMLSDSSVSSGVRRIEGITYQAARNYLNEKRDLLEGLGQTLKTPEVNLKTKVDSLLEESKKQQRKIKELESKIQNSASGDLFSDTLKLNDQLTFTKAQVEGSVDLRKMADLFINKYPNGILLISSKKGDKASVLMKTDFKKNKINVSSILKDALSSVAGRGGGKPEMGQGSCDFSKLADVEKFVKEELESLGKI